MTSHSHVISNIPDDKLWINLAWPYIQGKEATSSKYLGVTIDEHLKWNDHVKTVISKAYSSSTVQALIVKARCYNSMITLILEYTSAIWSPYTQKNIDLLEAEQKQLVRFILRITRLMVVLQKC